MDSLNSNTVPNSHAKKVPIFHGEKSENKSKSLKDVIIEEYKDFRSYIHILFRKKLKLDPYWLEHFGDIVSFNGVDGYIEKERYWVNKPCAFISILFNQEKNEHLYFVVEPELSVYERIVLETIYENILDTISINETGNKTKEEIIEDKTIDLIDSYSIEIDAKAIYKILYFIKRDYIGYERLDALMRDPNIEDISCDGSDIPIFIYHRKFNNIKTNLSFEEQRLDSFVVKLTQRCGKQITLGEPLINSTLPDGSRLNASLGKEVTFRGSTFTIRKFRDQAFTPADLIRNGTYSSDVLAFIWLAVETGKSIIFSGATAAGKTSSLNSVSLFIPPLAKIVSIEDTHELMLHHTNWIGSVTRESLTKGTSVNDIDMYELLRQALRQRPEYIIVGEIRGKEGMTLFQAMNTGHTTYSTMHADSVNTVVSRLEGDPINVPRVMIQALDILCIQKIMVFGNKKIRRLDQLVEFMGIDQNSGELQYNELYYWDPKDDTFKKNGKSFITENIMATRNWDEKKLITELDNRQKILEFMVKNEMDEFEVVSLIHNYYTDAKMTMEMVTKGTDTGVKK
ncbi:MAG: type II/IV secretion system ATPase subunit [Candidatus Methanoperedens sp.]|nr:type II/IV secretion system ATPase subunit [Candidatus Methanoperedens sp.]